MATHSSQTRDLGATRVIVSMWRQYGLLDIDRSLRTNAGSRKPLGAL
jgi:hypothetical protein